MIYKLIICLFMLGTCNFAIAQNYTCGTPEKTDEEMQLLPWYGNNAYVTNLADSIETAHSDLINTVKSNSSIPTALYRVPIQFWVYRSSSSDDNGMNEAYLQDLLESLNDYYSDNGTHMMFYQTCEIYYIDNDEYLYVEEVEENDLIRDNYIEGVINVHCVADHRSAGIFIRLLSKDGIIINQTWANNSTFAHEIGHYFDLEHTHRNSDKGKCRQESVSRAKRFTWIQNGTCLKYGLICESNGDGLCDTPADPDLSNDGMVSACNFINTDRVDEWGDLYSLNPPHVDNIMSYAGGCRNAFTQGQIGVMINKLILRGLNHSSERYMFDEYEPNNAAITARPISLNTSQHHTFHWSKMSNSEIRSCDDDWISFEINTISEGKLLQIVTSEGEFDNADTELYIYNESDLTTEIAYDDDSNQNGFSRIIIENLPIGEYFINVKYKTLPSFNSIIDYVISIEECAKVDECVSGSIDNAEAKTYYGRNLMASPCINGDFDIKSGGSSIFVSDQKIKLNVGFSVKKGGYFNTQIKAISDEACFSNEFLVPLVNKISSENEIANSVFDQVKAIEFFEKNDFNLKKITIYPNPTNSILNVESNKNIKSIIIINTFGNVVYSKDLNSHKAQIDISSLMAGVYMMKITGAFGETSVKKIVKE